ncbi:MAG: hypothetical protein ACLPYY_09925 [Acidimicrobiales bacterium]
MSQFVDDCRKEWKRLGVPEPLSNEMAADLEADLAEAASEGVSPEEVLGNGFFDARSFAASWAVARGVGHPRPRGRERVRLHRWALAVGALAFIGVAAVGLVLAGHGVGSVSVAAAAFPRPTPRPVPGILIGPHHLLVRGPGGALPAVGWVLLVVGLVGLGVTLWIWRPWSSRRDASGFDQNVGLPSYL